MRRGTRGTETERRVEGVRSRAQCEPLLSGTSARRRVQVVSCSFSTFLHDAREVFPPRLVTVPFGFTANRRYPINDTKLRCLEPRLEGLKHCRRLDSFNVWTEEVVGLKDRNFGLGLIS